MLRDTSPVPHPGAPQEAAVLGWEAQAALGSHGPGHLCQTWPLCQCPGLITKLCRSSGFREPDSPSRYFGGLELGIEVSVEPGSPSRGGRDGPPAL